MFLRFFFTDAVRRWWAEFEVYGCYIVHRLDVRGSITRMNNMNTFS